MSTTDADRYAAATGMHVRKKRDVARASQGRIIQAELRKKGWTQSDLARATGLPRYTISRAVRGENVLSAKLVEKLAKAFGISPDDIVRGSDRSSLDDMPTGVHTTHLSNGEYWIRMNMTVPQGINLAIEALAHHGKALQPPQLAAIFNTLAL